MFEDILVTESILSENDEVETEIVSTEDYLNEDDHEENEHDDDHDDNHEGDHCHDHEHEHDGYKHSHYHCHGHNHDHDEFPPRDDEDDDDEYRGAYHIAMMKSNPDNVPVIKDNNEDKYYVSAKDVEDYMEASFIDDPVEALNNIIEANAQLSSNNLIVCGVVDENTIERLNECNVLLEMNVFETDLGKN